MWSFLLEALPALAIVGLWYKLGRAVQALRRSKAVVADLRLQLGIAKGVICEQLLAGSGR
jgi:hypothetical protein